MRRNVPSKERIVPIKILEGQGIKVIDQTLLPNKKHHIFLTDTSSVIEAIQTLRVRGAPLLGIVGACGLAIASEEYGPSKQRLRRAANRLTKSRPTANNLGLLISESLNSALLLPSKKRSQFLWNFAKEKLQDQKKIDLSISKFGITLPHITGNILTHCNTGPLATGAHGTALAIIEKAWLTGKIERCYATETRPLLQGARLTIWELSQMGVPATLLPDNASASLISSGLISAVITGADRIANNGDTANKIGTYGLAVLAKRHNIPFYIAAPTSTIDKHCTSGERIPIEHRDSSEVEGFQTERWTTAKIDVYNPAFDVTPKDLISAIITEQGVLQAPYQQSIAKVIFEHDMFRETENE